MASALRRVETGSELKKQDSSFRETVKDTVKTRFAKATATASDLKEKATTTAVELKDQTVALVKNPDFQTCTLTTAGGVITLGGAGGAFGLASGMVVGGAAGVVPAIFTFGLSIPVGATLGGGGGLCLGGLMGGTAGGAAGLGAYKYRVELKDGLIFVKRKALTTAELAKKKTQDSILVVRSEVDGKITAVRRSASDLRLIARRRSSSALAALRVRALRLSETRVGCAATGAVAGGAAGAACGAAVGGLAGGALGVVPSLFTFGLSIPATAIIGACAGTVTGGGMGVFGGGAVGATGFTYRKEIANGVEKVWADAGAQVGYASNKVRSQASALSKSVRSLVGSTGGSD